MERGGSGPSEGGLAVDKGGDCAEVADAVGRRRGGSVGGLGAATGADGSAVGAEEEEAVGEAGGANAVTGLGRVLSAFPEFFSVGKEFHPFLLSVFRWIFSSRILE